MSIILTISDENFKSIVKLSESYADICRKLGLRRQGGFYRTIQRRIKKLGINTNHFPPISKLISKSRNFSWLSKENFLKKLKDGKHFCEGTLKKKIIEFNLLPYKCSSCSLEKIWNNKPIKLQLDHIDGNHKNDTLLNFRWLCPNCHSQTETFCGKRKKRKEYRCEDCGKNISKSSQRCLSCAGKIRIKTQIKFHLRRPSTRPPKEELSNLLGVVSFRKLGRKYNVSDNAVKKWCKFYGLPSRKKDLVGNSGVEPLNEVCKTSGLPLA